MKYFIDTEFLEGTQDKTIFGIKYGVTKPVIDLISIGIVSENGDEYYAISKDFNLKEAWNRYDLERQNHPYPVKKYWFRENVLKQIWHDLFKIHGKYSNKWKSEYAWDEMKDREKYVYLKLLLLKYGKTKKQIAEEIKSFVINSTYPMAETPLQKAFINMGKVNPEFYGYYSAYDWVVFCGLFDKMINLPQGYSDYCNDLVQIENEKANSFTIKELKALQKSDYEAYKFENGLIVDKLKIDRLRLTFDYPAESKNHNALEDAKRHKKLYHFLNTI